MGDGFVIISAVNYTNSFLGDKPVVAQLLKKAGTLSSGVFLMTLLLLRMYCTG
jgi:hypothetical protein